ncbi:sulfite exporter TauE/SafE family protein 3 isoform X2 [Cajanus cajan]|uniref:sulfite exporter TauE/SafE family protein 3 isoform X2 n=1 Tax=Cajanus cajan TaxID=3821 RepID=UPI00098D95E7|nr:sulfite exporter TauE/SafE family protein 3 isoform X2 [Cajanus cajan]
MVEFGTRMGSLWMVLFGFASVLAVVSAERSITRMEVPRFNVTREREQSFLTRAVNFLWQSEESGYHHVWPDMKFGWQIVVGTFVGFCGAAFGSVGGVGGGGIFVPMLSLIIGFDAKSSTAISKCMIMGAAVSTVYYNLKLRHPTLNMPIIDYDLALLIQPMLMLGISIGVVFNVVFPDWIVTILLIVLFLGTSTKAFFKGVETWKKETIMKKEIARRQELNGSGTEVEYKPLPTGPNSGTEKDTKKNKETYTSTCSTLYWVLNLLQVPISIGVTAYEAAALFSGRRVIASTGDEGKDFTVLQLVIYCVFGILAGLVGGLLGLGGGFVMGPLFLELGVPPQVSSATATFAMTFSSSMSVIEYYLLKRFPVPYAVYFTLVATVAAFVGQHIVRKLIILFGRASLIIFILASTIFVSAISLGGVGIVNMVHKIQNHEYMGFENLCKYGS